MCDFCHQHGEGKKWYLDARNYSEDMLSDLRRRGYLKRFFESPDHIIKGERALAKLDYVPRFLTRSIRRSVTEKHKVRHFGQVVPIEEIERILAFTTSVTRLSCICRHAILGGEHRYCYGLSMAPGGGEIIKILREIDPAYLIGPQTAGLESMSGPQALALMRQNEEEGLCHTVWTFITPFLAGICNCALPGCMAMRTSLKHKTPVMFRGEYVARVDDERCSGCGQCVKLCPFDAFAPHRKKAKARVDLEKCYGCGVCRSACGRDAIALVDRSSVPEAATLWL